MFKFSTIKFVLTRKLVPYRYGSHCISTCKFQGKAYLQILGSGAYGAPQSLFVQSPYHRFLFNCGEGTARICREYKILKENLDGIFFTSCSWEHVSGIPVFEAPFSHTGKKDNSFIFCGPPALEYFLREYSSIIENDFDISSRCFVLNNEERVFQDSLVVKPVPLFLESSKNLSSKEISSNHILAYICTFPKKEEIQSTNKSISRVPPKPSVESFKNEVPVNFQNSQLFTRQENLKHSSEESTFVVLEIPTVEYLETLLQSPDFDKYKKGTCENLGENNLKVIIHFSPPEVMKDSRYRHWVNSFPPSVSHMVINNRSSCRGLKSSIQLQLQLNQVMPDVFPLHQNPGLPLVGPGTNTPKVSDIWNIPFTFEYQFDGATIQSNSGLCYHFIPFREFDNSRRPFLNLSRDVRYLEKELVSKSLNNLKVKFDESNREKDSTKNLFPSVLFLGTGSGTPIGVRNTSSILIRSSLEDCVLLDCGGGTLNQLIRFLGKDETMSTFQKLKLIFISHRHQDHHGGLIALLNKRREAFMEAGLKKLPILYVLAPREIIRLVKKIGQNFALDFESVLFINNNELSKNHFAKSPFHKAIKSFQLEDVVVTKVSHNIPAYGVALTHKDGWKIAYSGDTVPCLNLIEIGKNCDLLIHEATFGDKHEEIADLTHHSTFSQAIKVGKAMNAKFTILTHFSKVCGKVPFVEENALKEENVGIAFDFMKVTFEDFPYLQHIYPTLKEICSDNSNFKPRFSEGISLKCILNH